MIAEYFIRNDIRAAEDGDAVEDLLLLMEEARVRHLPVLQEGVYQGLVSEEQLLESLHEEINVSRDAYRYYHVNITSGSHLFEAIGLIGEHNLSMLPVLDTSNKYIGYIYPQDVVVEMGKMLSIKNPGGIVVLEMRSNDYQLSQIAQIIESNDARILACYLTLNPSTNMIEVTLRINKKDLSPVLNTLRRYNYSISATYHESVEDAEMMNRYENFMKFLNM
jgi:predicted transcriptional regulator